MTAPGRAALSVEGFVRQVELACADLPESTRRQLLVDLDAHLREIADEDGLLTGIGDPADYAREMRAAMGFPDTAPPTTSRRRHALLWAALTAALVLVAGLITAIVLATRPSRPGRATETPTSGTRSSPVTVVVPAVRGLTATAAESYLTNAGLHPVLIPFKGTGVPAGRVAYTLPSAGTVVAPGSTVQLAIPTTP